MHQSRRKYVFYVMFPRSTATPWHLLTSCYSFGLLGGGKVPPLGTFAEYIVVERDQVIPAPDHLDDVQVAAWPLGGLTAWRST